MTPKHTSGDKATPIRVVIVTMDTHLASATERSRAALARDYPGLTLSLHAASEYAGNDRAIARVRASAALPHCAMSR